MSFSSQPPFAEVLGSELLLNGLSFSPFRGCFGQVLFSPVFDSGFQNGKKKKKQKKETKKEKGFQNGAKECSVQISARAFQRVFLLAKFGFDTAENEP